MLNRPGGNLTGVSFLVNLMASKRFELLHETLPKTDAIAFLMNPTSATGAESEMKEVQDAARTRGHSLLTLNAKTAGEIETAFSTLIQQRAGGLIIEGDSFFYDRREQLVALAARHAVPAVYPLREYVAVGGLMSYGTNFAYANRQAGIYVGKILRGEKPADLPVMQSTKFEFVVNLKTAKALAITVPPTLQALADEIIE